MWGYSLPTPHGCYILTKSKEIYSEYPRLQNNAICQRIGLKICKSQVMRTKLWASSANLQIHMRPHKRAAFQGMWFPSNF